MQIRNFGDLSIQGGLDRSWVFLGGWEGGGEGLWKVLKLLKFLKLILNNWLSTPTYQPTHTLDSFININHCTIWFHKYGCRYIWSFKIQMCMLPCARLFAHLISDFVILKPNYIINSLTAMESKCYSIRVQRLLQDLNVNVHCIFCMRVEFRFLYLVLQQRTH